MKRFASLQIIFISQCFQYERLRYGDYEYPLWADIIGLCISFSSMMWVPVYALYYVFTEPGTVIQVSTTKVTNRNDVVLLVINFDL